METFKIDMRIMEVETRQIRDGVALLFQSRSTAHNPDRSIDVGEWKTNSTYPNYGDVYDQKPSFFGSLFDWIFRG